MKKQILRAVTLWLAVVGLSLGSGLVIRYSSVQADDKQNVAMHEIGSVNTGAETITVFKMIHSGCEIFVAKTSRGWETPVAITTGRGCK